MALQTSGQISINDIHLEVGGSSASEVAINDSDIRGLIGKSSGGQMAFNEWYGASSSITATLRQGSTSSTSFTLSGLSSSATTLIAGVYFWHEDVFSVGYAPSFSVNGNSATRDIYKHNYVSNETQHISFWRYYIGTSTSVTIGRSGSPTGGYNTQGLGIWECTGNLSSSSTSSTSGSSISMSADSGDVVFVGAAHNWSGPSSISNLDNQQSASQHKYGVDMKSSSGSVTYSTSYLQGGMAAVRYTA
ncbi:hypothetical protein N9M73_07130 [Rhodobacteraceae bacterium]|nr:hypothetical protein [Paracoccaceae bacterium]